MTQATISNGLRMSTAHCFLTPAAKRNVKVETETLVAGLRSKALAVRVFSIDTMARGRCARILRSSVRRCDQLTTDTGAFGCRAAATPAVFGHPGAPCAGGRGRELRDHLSPRLGWGLKQRCVIQR